MRRGETDSANFFPDVPPEISEAIEPGEITRLLGRWGQGDREAAGRLLPLVYEELHKLARLYFLRERPDHTLQPTALVHEVCTRLLESTGLVLTSRTHLFATASRMMRRLLIDHSRKRLAGKRGGERQRVPLEAAAAPEHRAREILALEDALADLERRDPRKALLVELRFYGGLSVDEAAECLGTSPRSAAREWRSARAFLYRLLVPEPGDGP